ncbi:hypothetical protein FRC09_012932 [Ceratobasidium sp. 395]|nr:hypothetical protein FRC09_012932 [Ceratobasidium sp. 395]
MAVIAHSVQRSQTPAQPGGLLLVLPVVPAHNLQLEPPIAEPIAMPIVHIPNAPQGAGAPDLEPVAPAGPIFLVQAPASLMGSFLGLQQVANAQD